MQVHHYVGPRLAALEENLSQLEYLTTGNGKKKGFNKHRKPPSKLAIYQQQIFYEPQTDGCMGTTRSNHADELEPYQAELNRLHDPAADQDCTDGDDAGPEFDHSDTNVPWD